jgi:hypothetical protein
MTLSIFQKASQFLLVTPVAIPVWTEERPCTEWRMSCAMVTPDYS